MNSSPENQFKNFLIAIILILVITICTIVRPDFFDDFKTSHGLKLSSNKPWQEEINEDIVDDIDIEYSYPENEFKKEDSNNPFIKNNIETL